MRLDLSIASWLAATLALAGCGVPAQRVTARIERIERNCIFDETLYRDNGQGQRDTVRVTERKLECNDDPTFLAIRSGRKPNMRLFGHATVIVRYTSPTDRQQHQAWIRIDAADRAFYTLDVGQEVKVRLDRNDGSIAYL